MTDRAVLLGLIAMGMLAALCAIQGAPAIEADIRHRAIFAAAAVGVGPTMVHVSGRHVTLRGDAAQRDRLRNARDTIAVLPGVRRVVVEIVEDHTRVQGGAFRQNMRLDPPMGLQEPATSSVWSGSGS